MTHRTGVASARRPTCLAFHSLATALFFALAQAAGWADPSAPALPESKGAALSLAEAIALAREGNPTLKALECELAARDGALVQARLRPNPELRIELEDFAGSGSFGGFDAAQASVLVVQPIETGGKRARRADAAAGARRSAEAELSAARTDVAADAQRAYFAALALQQRLALAAARARVAEESLAAVAALVEAGGASAVETLRAQVELGEVRAEEAELAGRLAAARAELAAVWGAREARFGALAGELELGVSPPPLAPLLARLSRSPALEPARASAEERRARSALERAARLPDVALGVGARRFAASDDTAVVAELALALPLFDRNQGAIAEARARAERAAFEREAAEAAALARFVSAYERLAAAHARAASLERELIPLAEQAHRGARRGYQQGFFRLTDVLDAQRRWFELRANRLDALETQQLARIELERWLGAPLEAMP